ncbi:MAG TPA: M13 family metallopeptidase, partial [Thermoanaerobaculia bacterium]
TALNAQQHGVFLEDIDKTANACTNFFDYANGAWRAANPIPASMQRWSRRWAAGEQSKEQLRAILDDLSQRRDWPKGSINQQITDLYGSCMDVARINARGADPIKPYLAAIDAAKTKSELQQVIAKLHAVGGGAPFRVAATPDQHDPSTVIASVFASGLALPDRDYYLSTAPRFVDTRAKYLQHIENMFRLLGYDADAAKKTASTVFAFESRLATAHFSAVQRRDPKLSDNKMSVAALQKTTPHFDWKTYFRRTGVPVDTINVMQPKFLAAFDEELASTPLSAWKQYLRWQLLQDSAPHLSDAFANESFAFYGKYLGGATEQKPRWKQCVETTDSLLGEAVGQRYVERHFPPAAKARMQDMVKNLLAGMEDTIRAVDWMGPETKQKALEKLSTFNPKIGYPDRWKDYSSVTVKRDAYFENVVAGSRYGLEDDRSQMGKPVDRGRWEMTPPTSNAYYNPPLNEIVFPAGILQPPAFDMNATDAVNYGAIGVVIGHEISHGFDDQGRKSDGNGVLRDWWTAEDAAKFEAQAAKLGAQYEAYEFEGLPGLHINGKASMGENI